jgi:hypothetical protein
MGFIPRFTLPPLARGVLSERIPILRMLVASPIHLTPHSNAGGVPMRTFSRVALLVLLAVILRAPVADADLYTYTGGNFTGVSGVYTLQDSITGSFIVPDGYVPSHPAPAESDFTPGILSYSFTDEHRVLTQANSVGTFVFLHFPPISNDSEVSITNPSTGGFIVTNFHGDEGRLDATNWGGNSDAGLSRQVGHWTVTVPEPMSLLLLIIGIAGILGVQKARWI